MVDIAERLINYRPENEWGDGVHHTICTEAAGEIKSLRANLRCKETEALGYLRDVGTLQAEVRKLAKALERQCENMAFVINHVTLPDSWYEKFQCELDNDRAALDQDGGENE